MAKAMDRELAARLRAESEVTRDDDYPGGTRPARPNRPKVYSVRLSEQEQEQGRVESAAAARHLPASTLVRSWILDRLDAEKIA
ncbi:hypothetical protein AAEX63_15185 [Luteococcus sp. H138]|uniref:hypothetical protein n=1 Tax=unclassified Luteococcus TaxID=2639923 RepID=UPI00313D38D6